MPNTRKKVIKTVYKDEDESENEGHDFSDSGSEAVITDQTPSSSDAEENGSSDDDFKTTKTKSTKKYCNKPTLVTSMKKNFAKSLKKTKQKLIEEYEENTDDTPIFNIKDLTDADKLLPMLNLSESDSSDEESETIKKKVITKPNVIVNRSVDSDDDKEVKIEYKDVWSNNVQDNSEEIAKKTFMELEKHKSKLEEAKLSVQNYNAKNDNMNVSDVQDLLALGEEEIIQKIPKKKKKKIRKQDSDSEMEDWEEVKESKEIPQQGLQLIVDFPNACRKTKKLDVEMMMRRKINRVKKEYQVYMHKVHVLCWLGHGNYVSRVLNDQEVLAAALSIVPSKECYPSERVDIKYVEQITQWYKDKCTIKQDKSENKFKPKAPPLKSILLQQLKNRVFSTKKYMVFVFVSMLRSLGLQCRVMFNFVTLPIKPPASELCSLSTKAQEGTSEKNEENQNKEIPDSKLKKKSKTIKKTTKIPQLDGNYDSFSDSDNIMQVDGNDDESLVKTRRQKNTKTTQKHSSSEKNIDEGSVSPPKRTRKNIKIKKDLGSDQSPNRNTVDSSKDSKLTPEKIVQTRKAKSSKNDPPKETSRKSLSLNHSTNQKSEDPSNSKHSSELSSVVNKSSTNSKASSPRKTRSSKTTDKNASESQPTVSEASKPLSNKATKKVPKIVITNENNDDESSKYFDNSVNSETVLHSRKRSRTSEPKSTKESETNPKKTRTRSAHTAIENKSKYFNESTEKKPKAKIKKEIKLEDTKRVSHRDLAKNSNAKSANNNVTNDLVNIIKGRIKEAKLETKNKTVKKNIKQEASDADSDYLSVASPTSIKAESDDDFKPTKISPKPRTNLKKIDRRVLSTDDELPLNKIDVWCEIYVEELEEWVPVDVIKGQVHCVNEIYNRATHPIKYIVGWDNNNYLKDLTRRYVPQWNTVTRKQRVEPPWWEKAIQPWVGPKTAKDKEENERLDRMQLEAPLPKIISEYKNHPLYALKRHLLKFEAIYPADAAVLGFVRGEPVYARECVHVCRSREIWLKEAKVVKIGEQPYKIVKARPKWDKLSNKMITDKPLEIFGPWQVNDYEPPTAENGIVPRNPYGNVELFKECMLPKKTVLIKLPGVNRIAKKLNIDCAPAMTGFDYNGGYCHPVYDGFVVCEEFEQIITQAWLEDQEEQERKEEEKLEARVYGNWRKLIRGLLIKERLKAKYGFQEPSTSQDSKKPKGPRLVVKKK